ncbi:MAG: hypothetical protein GTO48_02670, partial [Xanthomonadales bacterium]|nr:hypothetical protein [Xanthomonadales bacterium]NIO12416.1 hypothetical protein [Xanthomonadales bacterium]
FLIQVTTGLKRTAVEVLALDEAAKKTAELVTLEPGDEYQVGVTIDLTAA